MIMEVYPRKATRQVSGESSTLAYGKHQAIVLRVGSRSRKYDQGIIVSSCHQVELSHTALAEVGVDQFGVVRDFIDH